MGAKFHFFTDPGLLLPQTADQAFGPATPANGQDRFRVTDTHATSAAAPAFAICDGLLCAQQDDQGTLTLILKPSEQPPFDFPAISYILYKGIDPASLLVNGTAGAGGVIDTSQANVNALVDLVQKTWSANESTGAPARECLGLHLTPVSLAASYPDLDLSRYAATEPLDRLFYQGDPSVQLALVHGGSRIGTFTTSAFGLEIVTERIGYRPRIRLARTRDNVVAVASLDPAANYATDDDAYFRHWHNKEECLNFIDPCAFWGTFFAARLQVWNAVSAKFEAQTGDPIYEAVLRGGHDDASATAGNFFNRNTVYVDLRNEHDQSLNYYKTNGDTILATFDPAATLATSPRTYPSGGWPIFRADHSMFPPAQTGPVATLRLAFIPGNYSRLSVYAAPQGRGRSRKTAARAQSDFFLPDATTVPEFPFDVPVYGPAPSRSVARYLFMAVFLHEPRPPEDFDAALDLFPWPAPDGIPFSALEIPFETAGSAAIKTYAPAHLLRIPFVSPEPTAYRIGWIHAGTQAALVLNPVVFDARDLAVGLPPTSANYAGGNLLDAVDQLIKPFTAEYRQASDGGLYVDFSPPASLTDYVPRADAKRFMYFMSAQTLADIQANAGPEVAMLTIAPVQTGDPTQPIVMCLKGLRTEDTKIVAFAVPLDAGGRSNVDLHE